MTLDEVQKEIDKLKGIERKLIEEEEERYNAKATKYVGKCYCNRKGVVLKILRIPQRVYGGDFQWHYRRHYFPVLCLRRVSLSDGYLDDFTPCYCDEVYFDIYHFNAPKGYTEITQDEFNEEFDICIEHFKEQIQ